MNAFNSPNPQMVVEVNYKLRNWALLEFLDIVRMVFKFLDFDLAPTIEEISGFIDLPYNECEMMVPYKPSSKKFLKRSLVFPKIRGRNDTRLGYVVRDLAQREDEPRKTIVPMILAEIMRSLSACINGRMFFDRCNLLLQLWAVEYFYLRSDAVDIFLGYGNKNIDNRPRIMVAFTALVGFVDWQILLIELESYHIQWKLHWLSTPHSIVRGDDRYFIELIGLKGVQPYAHLRVLRQFGRTQVIPLRSDMEKFQYEFELDKPQVHIILRRWERVLIIPMGARQALCTREYYIWFLKEVKDKELSGEGYYELTDERENIWARNVLKIGHETMVYHTRSKDTLPSLPNENRKGKRKATNEKVMSKTIEKKHPLDELVSRPEHKIRELEEEVIDMRGWAKLLVSVDPTLETKIDKPPVTSQAHLQNNPPSTHPTSQNHPSFVQMPPKNTHFPNYPYPSQHHAYASRPPYITPCLLSPTLQTPQYQPPLHRARKVPMIGIWAIKLEKDQALCSEFVSQMAHCPPDRMKDQAILYGAQKLPVNGTPSFQLDERIKPRQKVELQYSEFKNCQQMAHYPSNRANDQTIEPKSPVK
ncbi:hypothetical protein KY285_023639 [Solanum tuberosum]|nr:hypothetical protein KY289_025743 [Solanum tuberosum]KAH0675838.1 hypothetical protein KY285_023639 [Solanum tuberosum]